MNHLPAGTGPSTAAKSVEQLLALDDHEFVRAAYWTLFGRDADPGGLVHYVQALRAGSSKEHILYRLSESEEFRRGAPSLDGLHEVLARGRADGGRSRQAAALPQDEVAALLALEGHAFVQGMYRLLLGREPDPEGMRFYVRELAQAKDRRDIVAQVLRSDEFARRGLDAASIAQQFDIHSLDGTSIRRKLMKFLNRTKQPSRQVSGHGAPQGAEAKGQPGPQAPAEHDPGPLPVAEYNEAVRAALRRLPALRTRPRAGTAARHAAVTIVSKNYFAQATTLARSFKRAHPGHDFLIILVDSATPDIAWQLDCGAEVIEMADLEIPDISRFIYRYSIMELNTAVKPFALDTLFRVRGYETLLYIDPDILVFQPLEEVYEALDAASVVLIPHVRRPYFDDRLPSEASLIKSGTYNLGFIGLRKGETATQLLAWWMSKLYFDCVVDIPNGLFVDQKWMDMVPGFFPDHRIIYHPGYNAAYWNLHERPVAQREGEWLAGASPLVFFHYSGYNPFIPNVLSRHQNRHALVEGTPLRKLTDAYADALFENGYASSSGWPYDFAVLGNGVKLPLDLVREIMQWAGRAGIPTPCPVLEPDAYCCFLMSKGRIPGDRQAVLLFHFLLKLRGDVAAAFPGCSGDHSHEGFRTWLQTSGVREYELSDLLGFEGEVEDDALFEGLELLKAREGQAGWQRLTQALGSAADFHAYTAWVRRELAASQPARDRFAAALEAAVEGVVRILHIYYLRPDLQQAFPQFCSGEQVDRFAGWLRLQRTELELSEGAISLFAEFAKANARTLELARLLYFHRGATGRAVPSVFDLDKRMLETGCALPKDKVRDWLANEAPISLVDQWQAHRAYKPEAELSEALAAIGGASSKRAHALLRELRDGDLRQPTPVNLAGDLQAPSGIGESARSMRATLANDRIALSCLTMPHPQSQATRLPAAPDFFGWPKHGAGASILVTNADQVENVLPFLPSSFWGERRIGYWAWETEELPAHQSRSARHFDEVWTPSAYSAAAIRKVVAKPVKVVPHVLDFPSLDAARGDRKLFRLPGKGTLFGFMFDPLSGLERKNVRALIAAFRSAFAAGDDAYLVLKVNGKGRRSYEFDRLLASVDDDRILLVEETMSRARTCDFLASLDAYVSLHRSEGFGLTCAEAMALGKPVVASAYSGNLDFMDRSNSLLVPTPTIVTDRAFGPYPPGTVWGDPDVGAAAQAMRRLLDAGERRDIGRRASVAIRQKLAAGAVGQLVLEHLHLARADTRAAATA